MAAIDKGINSLTAKHKDLPSFNEEDWTLIRQLDQVLAVSFDILL
jgi:hypothetical protein